MYCLCVNVYCHRVTTQLQLMNISYHIGIESFYLRSALLWDVKQRKMGSQLLTLGRLRLKCDGMWAETRFHLSAKQTSPLKSAGVSVQSTTGSRSVRTSGSNAGYTMFLGSVKGTGYALHSPISPSLPLPCITVCHHVSTGLYHQSVPSSRVKQSKKKCQQLTLNLCWYICTIKTNRMHYLLSIYFNN
jgi:hypothetical protein